MSTGDHAGLNSIVLSKVEALDERVELTRHITIDADFLWYLSVGDKKFPSDSKLLDSLPRMISSVSDIEDVIKFVDSCMLCIGNPDDKYRVLISARKGVFMDSSGT